MSAKNKLQEFCQEQKELFPVYATLREPDTPVHIPLWVSQVKIRSRLFTGESATKKSVAECNAAEEALRWLLDGEDSVVSEETKEITVRDLGDICENTSTIVLVDIENIPQVVRINTDSIPVDTIVVGVVGHCHPMATRSFPFHKYIVRSSIKDAVDHTLSFITGFISAYDMEKFVIVSRDHFAEATVWNLNQIGYNAVHVTNLQDMMKNLK